MYYRCRFSLVRYYNTARGVAISGELLATSLFRADFTSIFTPGGSGWIIGVG